MKRTFGNMISNTFKKRKTTVDGPALSIPESEVSMSPGGEIPNDPFNLVKLIVTPRRKKTAKERKTPSTINSINSERQVQSERQKKIGRRRTLFQKENFFSENFLKKTPSRETFQTPDNIFQFGAKTDRVNRHNNEDKEDEFDVSPEKPTKRILFMDEEVQHPMTFDIVVHEARNLISSSVGFKDTSDPYVVLQVGGMSQKTKKISSTVNPKFNQQFIFFKDTNLKDSTLDLKIYDHDEVFDHECLGSLSISLEPAIHQCKKTNNSSEQFSNWYPIENGTGEISISFRAKEGVDMKF
eukprot:gene11313-4125_t